MSASSSPTVALAATAPDDRYSVSPANSTRAETPVPDSVASASAVTPSCENAAAPVIVAVSVNPPAAMSADRSNANRLPSSSAATVPATVSRTSA